MYRSELVLVLLVSLLTPAQPEESKGQVLFQSSVQVVGGISVKEDLTLAEFSEEDLLSEGDGEGAREGAAASQLSAASANASPEGVELLRADVKWLWSKLGQAFRSCSEPESWTLGFGIFRSDILAWLTALVSFGLTRSLLAPSPEKKLIDDKTIEEDEEGEEEQVQPSMHMEIKIDANNPVMIQRAREQLEEAEKRADALKTAQRDHRDVFGCTALHLAAHNCHAEDVEELLKQNFDVHAQEHFGETPLHLAARSGCVRTADVLLKHGSDPARRNSFGKTPFAVAMQHGHLALATMLREVATTRR